ALAGHLQRAVVLHHVFALRIIELQHRSALVEARLVRLRVDRGARDEQVMADRALQELRRRAYDPWHVAGRVDHGVPLAALERAQVPVAVAAQLLGLREQLRVGLAAVEERHLVAASKRRLDRGTAEELGPAKDEKLHLTTSSGARGGSCR